MQKNKSLTDIVSNIFRPLADKDRLLKIFYWLALLEFIFFLHWINLYDSDEGIVLSLAQEILNGKKLYLDLFEFVAPGSFYFFAAIFKIFGLHYFVAKLLAITAIFFSAVGVFKVAKQIFKNNLIYLSPFIFVFMTANWPVINYNTFNLLITIWAIYFFIRFITERKINYIIACGILTCLAILFHQTKGLVILFILSSFLLFLSIKEKNNYWLKMAAYYFSLSLAPLTLLFLFWPPKLLFYNLFIFPFFNYSETVKAPYYLLSFFLFFLFFCAWHLRKEQKTVWLLLYLQLMLLLSAVPLANSYHINLILFPLIALLPLTIDKLIMQKKILRTVTLGVSLIALYITLQQQLLFTYVILIKNRTYDFSPLEKYVQKNCSQSKYIYAGPFLSELYFELRRPSPTPYIWLITNHHTSAQFLEARDYLIKNQPECAIMNYYMVKKYKYDINNPVDEYIAKNYTPTYVNGNISVYKKN